MSQIRFGTSGWRSVLAEDFTFANARRVVEAIGRVLAAGSRPRSKVLVGYDTRFLARRFASEASRLLGEAGFEAVLSKRPIPTPVLALEIRRQRSAGAINFTASHNPPQYLGIKVSTADGAPALPDLTARIEAEIAAIAEVPAPGPREVPLFDPVPSYLEDVQRKVSASEVGRGAPRFTIDFRHGTSAGFLDAYLETAGASVSRLNATADPLFGGESPQCGENELRRLGEHVRRERSRLGLSCDGDADRFGVCDDAGSYVSPNTLLALLLWHLLARKGRRGGVARSVATTHALDAIAGKFGVPFFETPVGFKFIGEKLIAGEILFGGEESAGLTIEGHVPEKDGILADLLTAEMVGATGRTIGELAADLDREIGVFRSLRLDLPLSPGQRQKLKDLRSASPRAFAGRKVASVNTLDGIKLLFQDGSWILVRESGTEPLARLYVEARSEEDARALARAGRQFLGVPA